MAAPCVRFKGRTEGRPYIHFQIRTQPRVELITHFDSHRVSLEQLQCVTNGELQMKKSLRALLIPMCLLVCFTCVTYANAQSNQEKKPTSTVQTNQEQKPTSPDQKPTNLDQKPTTPGQKPAINLQDYLGRYEADPSMVENFILDVFLEKDELWIKPSHSPKSPLTHKSGDSFVIKAVNGPIKFNRDAKGLVESLTLEPAPGLSPRAVTAKKLTLSAPSLKGSTTFRLKGYPNARVVAVAGSFNDWKQSQLLCGKEADEWVCRIDLAPGKYTYKFVIDGDWILDPENTNTEGDERGFENSVLVVK